MKTSNLLNDILHDDAYETFRDELAARMQAEARRKRFVQTSRWLALAASVAFMAAWFLLAPQTSQSEAVAAVAPVVAAEPAYLLRTGALADHHILTTQAAPELVVIATDRTQPLPSLTDGELLALFPNHPRALASVGDASKRFLFLNPEDALGFMASN